MIFLIFNFLLFSSPQISHISPLWCCVFVTYRYLIFISISSFIVMELIEKTHSQEFHDFITNERFFTLIYLWLIVTFLIPIWINDRISFVWIFFLKRYIWMRLLFLFTVKRVRIFYIKFHCASQLIKRYRRKQKFVFKTCLSFYEFLHHTPFIWTSFFTSSSSLSSFLYHFKVWNFFFTI